MSKANFSIEGFAAEPKQRVSKDGRQMLDVSVAHSPRRFNKQSQQWEPVKDRDGNDVTVWARATFFDDMAEFLQSQVMKGTLVRLEGEPRVNAYLDSGGQAQASIDIQFASLSIVPLKPRQDAQQQWSGVSSGAGAGAWSSGGVNGAQNGAQDAGGFEGEVPF